MFQKILRIFSIFFLLFKKRKRFIFINIKRYLRYYCMKNVDHRSFLICFLFESFMVLGHIFIYLNL